jgi:hypothetical protein
VSLSGQVLVAECSTGGTFTPIDAILRLGCMPKIAYPPLTSASEARKCTADSAMFRNNPEGAAGSDGGVLDREPYPSVNGEERTLSVG